MPVIKHEAKIGRNEPMPSICKICASVFKCRGEVSDTPQENPCFVEKDVSMYSEEMKKRILSYQPFTNSKRTVQTICDKFAHLRSHRITYKR
ncbi:hypothetical protein SAMN04487970_107410 [Paenibacillus tianmuensis]|uniref:Uncharacterized protein n=1 Tax=Paenibacillus tianmuensis TaxID=624147 RepID=A0A1G4TX38_9BACL|nr:hypothetical protein SAMN04487970_107410 [Paenibacillus tianmuensis]